MQFYDSIKETEKYLSIRKRLDQLPFYSFVDYSSIDLVETLLNLIRQYQ